MDRERWRQVEELFHSAVERPAEERDAYLAAACRGDEELLREVSSLLTQQSTGNPLDQPAWDMAAGGRLGPYELQEPIGRGGMGAVFKARDTRLDRNVAIKVSTAQFSGRFANEARSVAALNHPNICTLYDVGPNYLVMELVEGADLAGPVPIETAIGYARQIAAGLEAAHEKGIIHRDLKPANIKLTREGTIKILDFGLAKAAGLASPMPALTESGMILGTAAYMSPEQARGEPVDKRADIWAFGVVFYELLTGKKLFGDGKSVSDAIAAVLTREPDFNALPKGTPPRVRRLIEHCLRKDPKQRLRDIGDARLHLEESEPAAPAPAPTPTLPAPARRWPWVAGLAALALLAAFGSYRWLTPRADAEGPFQRIQITKLTDSGKAAAAAISPDGKYVVHSVTDEGKSSLWMLHTATGSNVQILPPAPGSFPSLNFSRDGNSLYYTFATGDSPWTMHTMPILGGNARMLAALLKMVYVSLSPDEKRLAFTRVAGADRGLFVADLDGSGERQLVARTNPESLISPAWSPDGKTIAYGTHSQRGPSTSLAATPVEGGAEIRIGSRLGYFVRELLWLPDGHGLIAAANAQYPSYQVWHVSYPQGQARRITNDLNNYSGLSLTGDAGALVTVQNETTSHLWVVARNDPGNAREISTGRLDGLNNVAWAGNGSIYFEAPDSGGDTQIWRTEVDGAGRRQMTTERLNGRPAPCGDDRHLVFNSYRAGTPHIWRSDLDGGNVRQLTNGEGEWFPACSPDGSWLTYGSTVQKRSGIWKTPIDGGPAVRIWDRYGRSWISPDGKLVLVVEFVGAESKVRIIPAGGGQPIRSFDPVSELGGSGVVRWSADGAALLYVKTVGGVSNIWQRPINGGEPKQVTRFTSQRITAFDLSRDGKRLALARGTTSSDVVLIKDLK